MLTTIFAMTYSFFNEHYGNPSTFQAIAVLACILSASVISLIRQFECSLSTLCNYTVFLATVVLGSAGVWTTHFISILGYRPDMTLTYEPKQTALSAAVSLVCVGLPLAIAQTSKTKLSKMLSGVGAGLGVWFMHYVGMLAIEGCLQQQSTIANVAAAIIGCMAMAAATASERNPSGQLKFIILFVISVTSTHGLALIGTTLTQSEQLMSLGLARANVLQFTALGAFIILITVLCAVYVTRSLEDRERRHASVLSTALQNMTNGLLYFNQERKLKLYNREYLSLFSLPANALRLGMSHEEIVNVVGDVHEWDLNRRVLALNRANQWMTRPTNEPIEFTTDNGRIIKLEVRSADFDGLVLTYNDVTEERTARTEANRLAFTDELTGLPNRRRLSDRLDADYATQTEFCLILLDVDRFKCINDSHGHHIGDGLLTEIAKRLFDQLTGVFLARLASDEFVVLSYGQTETAGVAVDAILKAFDKGFLVGLSYSKITCSIGICSSLDAKTPSDLMRFADIAHNEAKKAGCGRACAYTDEMRRRMECVASMEVEIEEALRDNQFYLEYQPVVEARSYEVIGYEALIRWRHPSKGSISPAVFIPAAEEAGLIEDIGAWVLMRACRDAVSLASNTYVAVNVSPRQFRSGNLLGQVTRALQSNDLPASRLEIELTETAMVEDEAFIANTLFALRNIGVKIAMDDFGTGYSSLAHLKNFPLDRIKIDRSFVTSAQSDKASMAVLRGIVQIASDMAVATLAEGVETEEQLNIIQSIGCDAIQGYYFGRPQPLKAQLEKMFERVA